VGSRERQSEGRGQCASRSLVPSRTSHGFGDASNTLRLVTTLYRCKAPTDLVCRCGRVARRMRTMAMDFDEVRVPFLKRDRPEVEELTGQRWVPVLVHGDDVIHDSHRILEYLEWLDRSDK
jgi:Glutathione S-transferase, N-terminal domain